MQSNIPRLIGRLSLVLGFQATLVNPKALIALIT
jgi:hypothetical protein